MFKNREEETSSIFDQRRGGKTSTSGRNVKEPSSNKDDNFFLMLSYEVDIVSTTKMSYEQLFRMSGQLEKENDKLRYHNLGLKESTRYVEAIIKTFKKEITKIRNSKTQKKHVISVSS